MRKNKILGVALAATILASGGTAAGSVFTAPPAEAATIALTTSAPANLKAFTDGATLQSGVTFTRPGRIVGTLTSYTVILKQVGKADRVFTNKSGRILFGAPNAGLAENTAYTVQVKANVVSSRGVKSTGNVASTTFKTGYSLSTVKPTAPIGLKTTDVVETSFVARWGAPVGYVGTLTGYTVTVKQAGVAFKTVSVLPSVISYKVDGLKAASAYTVEVNATFASPNKMAKASSAAATATAYTPKSVTDGFKPVVTLSNITSNSVVMNWKPVAGATTYLTFVSDKAAGSLVSRGEYNANTLTAGTPNVLKPGTTYLADVQAVIPTADGTSWKAYSSGLIEFTTPAAVAPVVTISDITSNSATINWTPSSNVSIYMVGIVEKGTTATAPGTRWGPDRTSIGTGAWLKPNTTYVVGVQAFLTTPDSAGNSAYYTTTEFTTKG